MQARWNKNVRFKLQDASLKTQDASLTLQASGDSALCHVFRELCPTGPTSPTGPTVAETMSFASCRILRELNRAYRTYKTCKFYCQLSETGDPIPRCAVLSADFAGRVILQENCKNLLKNICIWEKMEYNGKNWNQGGI